jgi:hypothetical protein
VSGQPDPFDAPEPDRDELEDAIGAVRSWLIEPERQADVPVAYIRVLVRALRLYGEP